MKDQDIKKAFRNIEPDGESKERMLAQIKKSQYNTESKFKMNKQLAVLVCLLLLGVGVVIAYPYINNSDQTRYLSENNGMADADNYETKYKDTVERITEDSTDKMEAEYQLEDPAYHALENERLTRGKPPTMHLIIAGERHETGLGSYCWPAKSKNEQTCVETMMPSDDIQVIVVQGGEEIKFEIDHEPLPDESYLIQFNENSEHEIEIDGLGFKAPNEKGIYNYLYRISWLDAEDAHHPLGDSSYGFRLEVR